MREHLNKENRNNGLCVTRRAAIGAVLAGMSFLGSGVISLSSPSAAYALTASEQDAILAQAKDLRSQLSEAEGAYYEAVARKEGAEMQRQQAEEQLTEIEGQLSSEQEILGTLLRSDYMGSSRLETITNILSCSDDVDTLLERIAYYQNLTAKQTSAVESVVELRDQQQQAIDEIDKQIEEIDKQTALEEQKQQELHEKIAEIQPQINEIADAVMDSALSTDKNSALEPIMSYLTSVSDVTDAQSRILKSAMQLTQYAGSNYCERWVNQVYRNAGFDVPGYASAYADYLANGTHSLSEARPGALLFGAGSSTVYNHVMIVVSVVFEDDGVTVDKTKSLCIDNELARAGRVATWAEQEEWFVAGPHGGATMWSCGTYPGVDLGF